MRFGMFDQMERTTAPIGEMYRDRLRLLEVADEAGFWCYFKSEHHLTPLDMAPSTSTWLSAIVARTTSLRVGSLVYLLPFHHRIPLAFGVPGAESTDALVARASSRLHGTWEISQTTALEAGLGGSPDAEHIIEVHARGRGIPLAAYNLRVDRALAAEHGNHGHETNGGDSRHTRIYPPNGPGKAACQPSSQNPIAPPGFEPGLEASKAPVLPLHHGAFERI